MSQFIEMFEFEDLSLLNPSDDFSVKCIDDTSSATKVPAGEYLGNGTYAIYDQSQDCEVAGYTDSHEGLCNNYPAVLFGDHSRVVKYINQPFFIGADGVKIIRPKNDDLLAEFLYYDLLYHNIPNTGYNRHFKYVKMLKLTEASVDRQKAFLGIAHQADKSKFVGFKSQFIEMFGDVIKNSNDWREYGPIGNYVDIVLGSTPDSKNPQYWDGDICWVTPAELNDDVVVINDTVRHITNDGVSAANLTKLPKGSVLFSTRAPIGKVAVTGVEMYCNQGFKNFICGDKLNNLYLYYTLKLNRDYLCALGTGTTFKELSKKVVESISIAIPPIEMQNKFEDVFKQADKSKYFS